MDAETFLKQLNQIKRILRNLEQKLKDIPMDEQLAAAKRLKKQIKRKRKS